MSFSYHKAVKEEQCLEDLQKLDFENERCAWRDYWWESAFAVGVITAQCEFGALANFHCGNAERPAFNDALADCKLKWPVTIFGRIEFFAVDEGAGVMN